MTNAPCCESGKLDNVKDNTLNLECSNCGTIYDLIESRDFKKYDGDSPVRREIQDTGDEEECCSICDEPIWHCICDDDEEEE